MARDAQNERPGFRRSLGNVFAVAIIFAIVTLTILTLASSDVQEFVTNNERVAYILVSIAVTVILAIGRFAYGSLERRINELRETSQKVDERAQEIGKEYSKIASEVRVEAKSATAEAVQTLDEKIERVEQKISEYERDHPWLKNVDPDFLAIYSKNLDAIFKHALTMYKSGMVNELMQWLRHVIDENDYDGSPESFMHLAEFLLDTLRDASLADKVILRYKELNGSRNQILLDSVDASLRGSAHAGVAAVELELKRRSGKTADAEHLARLLDAHLSAGEIEVIVVRKLLFGWIVLARKTNIKVDLAETASDWREEVYLARYYFDCGGDENRLKANELLKSSWKKIPKRESKSELFYAAADFSYALGATEKAVRLAEEAIYADANNLRAHLLLSEIFLTAARFEEAAVIAQNAAQIAPRSHLHLAALDRLREIAGAYAGERRPPALAATPEPQRRVWSAIMVGEDGVAAAAGPAEADYDQPPESAFLAQLLRGESKGVKPDDVSATEDASAVIDAVQADSEEDQDRARPFKPSLRRRGGPPLPPPPVESDDADNDPDDETK